MFALLAVVLLIVYFAYNKFYLKYADIDRIPGPSTFQLISDLRTWSSSTGILTYLQTLTRTYGPVVKVWIKPFKPFIVTTDVTYCNKILKDNNLHLTPSLFEIGFLRDGFATNLNYDIWKNDKQIARKSITKEYVSNRLDVHNRKYDELLQAIRNSEKAVDVQPILRKIQLEIGVYSLIDGDNVSVNEHEIKSFAANKEAYFELLQKKMNSYYMLDFVHKFTESYGQMIHLENEIVKFAECLLERSKMVDKSFREKDNVIYAMMDAEIPNDRIVNNITTLLQAGYDTMIFPACQALVEIAQHFDIQNKLLQEIWSVLGKDRTLHITLNQLQEMVYLDAFVKECVRLYIPAPFLDRKIVHDTTINGIKIPKDTVIMFNISDILRDEQIFENSLSFNPDRFLKENLTVQTQKGFIGFGWGSKECPGRLTAMSSLKLMVAKVLREFEIYPATDYRKSELALDIVFRYPQGLPIIFKPRVNKDD